jgi:hypothetical protein
MGDRESKHNRAVFDQVRVEPVSYNNHLIDQRLTDWLFFASGSAE